MLNRLPQWTAGGTSLRTLDRTGAGDLPERDFTQTPTGYVAGDDPEAELGTGGETWLGADDGEATLSGERLSVYRAAGFWRGTDGEPRLTVHKFTSEAAYARGECVLGQGALWHASAALSYMAAGPHDVRPSLLLLTHAQDHRALPACLRYGINYLTARGEPGAAAMRAAAADALSLLCRTRGPREPGKRTPRPNTPPVSERSRQFGMRNGDYADLRALMLKVYRRRLREAEQRFLACANYVAPKTGRSHASGFAPETWWHPERLPPANL